MKLLYQGKLRRLCKYGAQLALFQEQMDMICILPVIPYSHCQMAPKTGLDYRKWWLLDYGIKKWYWKKVTYPWLWLGSPSALIPKPENRHRRKQIERHAQSAFSWMKKPRPRFIENRRCRLKSSTAPISLLQLHGQFREVEGCIIWVRSSSVHPEWQQMIWQKRSQLGSFRGWSVHWWRKRRSIFVAFSFIRRISRFAANLLLSMAVVHRRLPPEVRNLSRHCP